MALTQAQLEARDGKLTASRIGILMGGDEQKLLDLWREMVGDPDYRSEDLSHIWPIILGSTTEEINLDRYEYKTGNKITRRGDVVVHPKIEWAAATLDGWVEAIQAPIEAKHVGGREPRERIIARYTPQCTWQMIVTGAKACLLTIIEAAAEPVVETIRLDDEYAALLMERATKFMHCVQTMTPPVLEKKIAPPVKATVTYEFDGNNRWASAAGIWLENVDAGKAAVSAEKVLKELVPADAERCHGHGVEVTRDRAGRLSLRRAA